MSNIGGFPVLRPLIAEQNIILPFVKLHVSAAWHARCVHTFVRSQHIGDENTKKLLISVEKVLVDFLILDSYGQCVMSRASVFMSARQTAPLTARAVQVKSYSVGLKTVWVKNGKRDATISSICIICICLAKNLIL